MSFFVTLKTLIRSLGLVGLFYQLLLLIWLALIIVGHPRIMPLAWGLLLICLAPTSLLWGERWRIILSNRRASLLPGIRQHAFSAILLLVALQSSLVAGLPMLVSNPLPAAPAIPLLMTPWIALTCVALGMANALARFLPTLLLLALIVVLSRQPEWLTDPSILLNLLIASLTTGLLAIWWLSRRLLEDRRAIKSGGSAASAAPGPGLTGKEWPLLALVLLVPALVLLSRYFGEGEARFVALVAWIAPLCVILPLLWRRRLNKPQWRRLSLLPGWSKTRLGQRLNRGLLQSVSLVVFGQWLIALASLQAGLAEPSRVILALLIAPAIAWLAVETILRLALVDDEELGGVLYLGVFIALGSLVLSSGSVVFFGIGLYPLGGLAAIGLLSLAGALMLRAGRHQAWHRAEF